MDDAPYNYKNVLKMKSGIGRKDEWTDISWLVSFRGEGSNYCAIGSVILESMDLLVVWRRHPSTVIRRIHFGYYSFAMVYSLQFLSIGAFSDAAALESVIQEYGGYL